MSAQRNLAHSIISKMRSRPSGRFEHEKGEGGRGEGGGGEDDGQGGGGEGGGEGGGMARAVRVIGRQSASGGWRRRQDGQVGVLRGARAAAPASHPRGE